MLNVYFILEMCGRKKGNRIIYVINYVIRVEGDRKRRWKCV